VDTLAPDDAPARLPNRLIVLVFAAIFAALAFGYWFFLSGSYAPAFTGLRPAEASAVVGQLTAKNIPYRLADGGATILVPSGEVDPARLAIAGSDVPMKGGVGFELFNKSDMGLTDFAQRINYQRALQGELERSIMMLDDVETARVHLAMPERTLFRADRNAAKAAVELVGKDGRRFDEARVAGIQRLVAFAVPDLAPADVVVLDADGKVLSATAAADEAVLTPEAEEQHAVSSYYRARIRSAITQALPGIQFDVKVLVDANATVPPATGPAPAAAATPTATATPTPPSARKFGLRITVATTAPLNPEDRGLAQAALAASVGYDERLGDSVSFEIGIGGATSPAVPTASPSGLGATPAVAPVAVSAGVPSWVYAVLAALVLAAVALVLLRRTGGGQLSDVERGAMVARLRASLRDHEEAHA
jgi:flagellar M-ring protein FliF